MIVGICGLIGSGKGTAADILRETHGFTKISFADSLKDGVAAMFDWPRDMLEGDSEVSRKWREQPDEFWTQELGHTVTPRYVLQKAGTECMRHGFFDGVWVSRTKQKIQSQTRSNCVVPDVRFPNEIDMIRSEGGVIVEIRRGEQPAWATQFREHGLTPQGIHASEWAWMKSQADYTIKNDSTIEDLALKLHSLVSD